MQQQDEDLSLIPSKELFEELASRNNDGSFYAYIDNPGGPDILKNFKMEYCPRCDAIEIIALLMASKSKIKEYVDHFTIAPSKLYD